MSKRPEIKIPTAEDDARIRKGIAKDADARELGKQDIAAMKPAKKRR